MITLTRTQLVDRDSAKYTFECATHVAEEKWREYTSRVDDWIAIGNYESMNKFGDECLMLDFKAHAAWLDLEQVYERAARSQADELADCQS